MFEIHATDEFIAELRKFVAQYPKLLKTLKREQHLTFMSALERNGPENMLAHKNFGVIKGMKGFYKLNLSVGEPNLRLVIALVESKLVILQVGAFEEKNKTDYNRIKEKYQNRLKRWLEGSD